MANCSQSHPEHEHKLKWKRYSKPYFCSGCKEKGFGPRYRCDICDYDLHRRCALAAPLATHPLFRDCTFVFQDECPSREERYCDGCGKKVHGFVYHCEEKDWDLHPCCLQLKAENFKFEGVEFQLLNKSLTSKCIWCDRKKLKDWHETRIPGWSFVSKCKNYQFHAYCTREMVLEAWKSSDRRTGIGNYNEKNLALDYLELPQQLSKRVKKKGSKFLKIVKMFLKAIACVLLGDPTISLTLFLLDAFSII